MGNSRLGYDKPPVAFKQRSRNIMTHKDARRDHVIVKNCTANNWMCIEMAYPQGNTARVLVSSLIDRKL